MAHLGKAGMTFLRRCLTAMRRDRLDDELREEIDRHIEQRRKQLIDDGMDPREALYESRRSFGNVMHFREESRDMWGFRAIDTLLQDVRYALRLMRRSPLFTTVGVLSIAIGIAASTLVTSIVNASMWRWAAMYRAPDRLTFIYQTRETDLVTPTPADYRDWRASATSFRSVDAYTYTPMNLSGDGVPERLLAAAIAPTLFHTLGIGPAIGAGFNNGDDVWGRHRRVLLTDGTAPPVRGGSVDRREAVDAERRALRGRGRHAAGRVVHGDAAGHLRSPVVRADDPSNNRNSHFIWAVARLADGVSLDAANAELDVIARQLAAMHPANSGMGARAVPMANQILDRTAATPA